MKSSYYRVIRIVLTTAVYAIFNLFAVIFYGAAPYLVPIPELYECFGLVSVFLLLVELAQPKRKYEGTVSAGSASGSDAAEEAGRVSSKWFLTIWIMVFQVLPGRVLTTIAAEVVEARRCHTSQAYKIAHIVIAVVQSLQTIVCLAGILTFHHHFRPKLRQHGGDSKLILFKLLVLSQLVQHVVFTALELHEKLHPTLHFSYLDLTLGTPPALTCIESFIFSVAFLWPFSERRLRNSKTIPKATRLPVREAIVDTLKYSYVLDRTWRLKPSNKCHEQGGDAVVAGCETDVNAENVEGRVQQVQSVPKGSRAP
jgi:Organic solute transporter Ostalpha